MVKLHPRATKTMKLNMEKMNECGFYDVKEVNGRDEGTKSEDKNHCNGLAVGN